MGVVGTVRHSVQLADWVAEIQALTTYHITRSKHSHIILVFIISQNDHLIPTVHGNKDKLQLQGGMSEGLQNNKK